MSGVRTVNLCWERRVRGAYPVSCYALANDGTLTWAVPRPLEARAFNLTRLSVEQSEEVCGGFSAETLLELETAAGTDSLVGMTSDDLYLFLQGQKSRFLNEKRILYVDSALCAQGRRLAAAYSDMAGSSFAVAYGDITGQVTWTEEAQGVLTCIALSREGTQVAFGLENGVLHLKDAARREVWRFGQEEPARALACASGGRFTVYGTAQGAVGLIDGEGTRLWETRLAGEVLKIALSGDGALAAVLCQETEPESEHFRVVLLTEGGKVGWEYTTDKRLVSLALSENGLYLALSARDGTTSLMEITPGEANRLAMTPTGESISEADRRAQTGDLEGALRTLQTALEAEPANLDYDAAYLTHYNRWLETGVAAAQTQFEAQDFGGALETLETMRHFDGHNVTVVSLLHQARTERGKQLLAEATQLLASGDTEEAERALREAVVTHPVPTEARRQLATLLAKRVETEDAEAERALASGDLEAGLAALERAQSVAPTTERAAKLRQTRVAWEFALGKRLYDEKRYPQAVFQFRKALAQAPDHAEAKRYLGFAEKFAQDASLDSLSDRFSRLE